MWQLFVSMSGGLFLAMLLVSLCACDVGLQPGRGAPSQDFQAPTSRDFGEEVYKFILREARIHPQFSDARAAAVKALRGDLILAANTMVPKRLLSPFEAYMRKLLPFYDDGTMSGMTQGMASMMSDLANEETAVDAFLRMSQKEGITQLPREDEMGLVAHLLSYPKHPALLKQFSRWWLLHDGVLDDGKSPAPAESKFLQTLLVQFGKWLEQTEPKLSDSRSFLLTDFLLVEDPKLDLKIGTRCAVRVNLQGAPVRTAAGKALAGRERLPVPFGLPQENGRGDCGQARTSANQDIYDTRDLSKTILGSLLWDLRPLILRELPLRNGKIPFPLNLTKGLRPLMAPVDPAKGGFKSSAPMVRLLEHTFPLLKGPQFHKVVRALARLADKEQKQLASMLVLLEQIATISKRNPSNVRTGSSLWEDLLPYLQEMMAQPGFLEDLLKALAQPGVAQPLQQGLAKMLRYRFKTATPDDYLQFKGGNQKAIFDQDTDFRSPDTASNRSGFMGLLHLLNAVNRHSYTSRLKAVGGTPIPFIEMKIENLALLYLRSIIGDLSIWETIYVNQRPIQDGTVKDLLKKSLPAMGFSSERPHPEELGVFINRELRFKDVPLVASLKLTITLDPIIDKDGFELRKGMGPAVLFALASGLITKQGGPLAPVAKVFKKYKKLPRFLDLLGVLHRHWASDANSLKNKKGQAIYPTPRTNLRSLGGMLRETLEQTDVLPRTEKLTKTLSTLTLSDAPKAELAADVLQRYFVYLIGKPNTPFKQTPLKPWFDAADAILQVLDVPANQAAKKAWEEGVEAVTSLMLAVKGTGDQAQFENPRIPVILVRTLEFFADEIKRRDDAGQWGPDLSSLKGEFIRFLTHPMLPPALEAFDAIVADRTLLELTVDMLVHMLPDGRKEPARFREILGLAALLLSPQPNDVWVPLMRYAGRTLQQQTAFVTRTMSFLQRSLPLDQEQILLALLRNGAALHPKKRNYMAGVFLTLFKELHRLRPGSKDPLQGRDVRSVLVVITRYLTDKEKGLEKIYEVVKGRNGKVAAAQK